jgi:hypothetical protein
MTKLNFEPGDKIGPKYILDEFAGTNAKGDPRWYVKDAETGNLLPKTVSEKTLREILRSTELTPQDIRRLSSKGYNELLEEIGQDNVDAILAKDKPKATAPDATQQQAIARQWLARHPQITKTKANTKLFDDYLGKMQSPSFTAKDFDQAFSDLFFSLELNPEKVGLTGLGAGIQGEGAIGKLNSKQLRLLQSPVKPERQPIDFSKLDETQTLNVIGDLSNSADEFLAQVRDIDRAKGIEAPVPPMLVQDRLRVWGEFFNHHRDTVPTEELQTALLELLEPNTSLNFNPKEALPVLHQHLEAAFQILIDAQDPVVQRQESGINTYHGASYIQNPPRPPRNPQPADNSEISVTGRDIATMDAATYGKNLQNPSFVKAVERLTKGA